MSLFGSPPEPTDWVQLTKPTGGTLMTSGLPRGTRGIVVERRPWSSTATCEFDCGWGTQRLTVPTSHLRVTRRRGGAAAFRKWQQRRTAARVGALLVLLGPTLKFAIGYYVQYGTLNGLLGVIAVGAVQGTLDMLTGVFEHPLATLLYLVVLGALSRLAFGPRRR